MEPSPKRALMSSMAPFSAKACHRRNIPPSPPRADPPSILALHTQHMQAGVLACHTFLAASSSTLTGASAATLLARFLAPATTLRRLGFGTSSAKTGTLPLRDSRLLRTGALATLAARPPRQLVVCMMYIILLANERCVKRPCLARGLMAPKQNSQSEEFWQSPKRETRFVNSRAGRT